MFSPSSFFVRTAGGLLVGIALGGAAVFALRRLSPGFSQGLDLLAHALRWTWHSTGPALVGLVPLALWLGHLLLRPSATPEGADAAQRRADFAFIGRNATLLGLLGTVLSLALAGARLAAEQAGTPATLVNGLVGLLGQALVSTIVGILLAVAADLGLHFSRPAVTPPGEVKSESEYPTIATNETSSPATP